jgi:hypothetical protein
MFFHGEQAVFIEKFTVLLVGKTTRFPIYKEKKIRNLQGGWRTFMTLLKKWELGVLIKLYWYLISGTPGTALLILESASVRRPSGEQTTAQGGDLIAIIF